MYLNECTSAEMLDRAARAVPDRVFLVTDEGALTFCEMRDRVAHAAEGLEKIGVAHGDRVLLVLNTCLDYPVAMFALHALGAIAVNVNPGYSSDELAYVGTRSNARWVIADRAFAPLIRDACADRPVIWIGAESDGVQAANNNEFAWSALLDNTPTGPLQRPHVVPDDAATVIFTSGTTSRPKGVVFRQGSHGFAGEYMARNLGVGSNDVFYCMFPLFHSIAISNAIFPMLAVGGTLVLKKFSASGFIDDVLAHKATLTSGGAPHWRMVLANAEKRDPKAVAQLSHLRIVLSGLSMTDDEYQAFEDLFGCRIVEIYGQTEGIVPCTIHPPHGLLRKRRSGGPAALGSEIRIVMDNGRVGGINDVGEIQFRTHGNGGKTLGYLDQPDETAKLFTDDGWIRSGDLGLLDEDGWLFFVDRAKDMVKVGGENVAASEVERVLDEHPSIKESAVIGVPDSILQHVIGAYVVAREGATLDPDEIIAYCAKRLAKFKVPVVVTVIDSLPRNAVGKVVKTALRR